MGAVILSYLFGVVGLIVFARMLWGMAGSWHRRGRTPMPPAKRLVALMVFGGGIYLLLTCVSDFTARRMDIYAMSLRTAASSKMFTEQIGEPYSVEWPIALNAEATDTDGKAEFSAKVKGPHGKGVLVAAGKKGGRVWHLTQLDLVPSSTGQYVSLLPMQNVQASTR